MAPTRSMTALEAELVDRESRFARDRAHDHVPTPGLADERAVFTLPS
jgi:hypothetical protein